MCEPELVLSSPSIRLRAPDSSVLVPSKSLSMSDSSRLSSRSVSPISIDSCAARAGQGAKGWGAACAWLGGGGQGDARNLPKI